MFAHFFQSVVGVHADTKAHAQDLGFPGGETREDVLGGFSKTLFGSRVHRAGDGGVLNEVAQVGVFIVTDGGLHGDRLFRNLEYLAHLVFRHFHALAQLFGCRFPAHFLQHLAGNAVELVDGFNHVHRNTNGPGLVGDGSGNSLANPPGGVGGELIAPAVLELVHRLHQADVAFLNEIEELQATVGVFLGDRNHQAQVGFHHFFLGPSRPGFTHAHAAVDLFDLCNRETGTLFDFPYAALQPLDFVLVQADAGTHIFFAGNPGQPAAVALGAREALDEFLAVHAALPHRNAHNLPLLLADDIQRVPGLIDQGIKNPGREFEEFEQLPEFVHFRNGGLVAATVGGDGFLGLGALALQRREPLFRLNRVGAGLLIAVIIIRGVGVGFCCLGHFLG